MSIHTHTVQDRVTWIDVCHRNHNARSDKFGIFHQYISNFECCSCYSIPAIWLDSCGIRAITALHTGRNFLDLNGLLFQPHIAVVRGLLDGRWFLLTRVYRGVTAVCEIYLGAVPGSRIVCSVVQRIVGHKLWREQRGILVVTFIWQWV